MGPSHPGDQILIVDDDAAIAGLLERLLTADGHSVDVARNGLEALAHLAEHRPDLIVLDLDMPGLGGFEVCERIKSDPATRLIPVLILTGRSAADNRLQAWQLGADEFLTKPFHNVEVRARCRSLIRQKRLVDELDSAQNVVFALARAVEAKSPYTQGHADRVTQHAIQLGGHVGISEADMEVLRQGAILHDVGKIKVPDAILEKPGPLTKEEYDVVKQHPVEGVRIIESLHSIREAVPLVRWHHERMDGAGYPDGLFGGEIPLLVRILAVADVYDALGSARPYRPALPQSKCMAMLQDNAVSGGLDPELVRCFADHLEYAPAMPPLATCP